MARRSGEPKWIGEIVEAVLPSRPRDGQVPLPRLHGWWARAVPPRIAREAWPVRLDRDGVLLVHARSAVWAAELDALRERLLAAVRRHAPAIGIRDLRIRVGPLPELPTPPVEPPPRLRQPTELPADVAAAVARIGDDEVRDAVASAAAASLGPPLPPPRRSP